MMENIWAKLTSTTPESCIKPLKEQNTATLNKEKVEGNRNPMMLPKDVMIYFPSVLNKLLRLDNKYNQSLTRNFVLATIKK
jgi:hypothetical protein